MSRATQEAKQNAMLRGKRIPEPTTGRCILREITDEVRSAGGIIAPFETGTEDMLPTEGGKRRHSRWRCIKTSGKLYMPYGVEQHPMQPGDEAVLAYDAGTKPLTGALDDQSCHVASLADVIAWHPCPVQEAPKADVQ